MRCVPHPYRDRLYRIERIRFYRKNNLLTSAISHRLLPEIKITIVKNEDYEILCHITDGVSDILTEEEINACCQKEQPAITLVDKVISTKPIFNPDGGYEFAEYICPSDNASTVVYSKKRTKNN